MDWTTNLEIPNEQLDRVEPKAKFFAVRRARSLEGRQVLVLGCPSGLGRLERMGETREDGGLEVDEEVVFGRGGPKDMLKKKKKKIVKEEWERNHSRLKTKIRKKRNLQERSNAQTDS